MSLKKFYNEYLIEIDSKDDISSITPFSLFDVVDALENYLNNILIFNYKYNKKYIDTTYSKKRIPIKYVYNNEEIQLFNSIRTTSFPYIEQEKLANTNFDADLKVHGENIFLESNIYVKIRVEGYALSLTINQLIILFEQLYDIFGLELKLSFEYFINDYFRYLVSAHNRNVNKEYVDDYSRATFSKFSMNSEMLKREVGYPTRYTSDLDISSISSLIDDVNNGLGFNTEEDYQLTKILYRKW